MFHIIMTIIDWIKFRGKIRPFCWYWFNYCWFEQPLYDSFFLTFYNIFFTSWPILIFGLFEQNYTVDKLLGNLSLYRDITNNARMSWLQFCKWNILGFLSTSFSLLILMSWLKYFTSKLIRSTRLTQGKQFWCEMFLWSFKGNFI